MTDSALIVFLPLVAAFVGAIIGAFANGLYGDWQDKKARDRERRGLLILVDAEIKDNRTTLQHAYRLASSHPQPIAPFRYDTLRTEGWTDAKVKLAQLLPTSHTRAIVSYYESLLELQAFAEAFSEGLAQFPANTSPPHGYSEPLLKLINRTRVAGERVTALNHQYAGHPGSDPPSFPESTQQDQN